MDSIAFYFDFVSPYAYLASNLVEELASKHQKRVHWLPFRLGVAVVKVMGLKPLLDTPLKSEYAKHDVARMAKTLGLPLTKNIRSFDPVPAQQTIHSAPSEIRADLAKFLLHACWADGADLGNVDVLIGLIHQNFYIPEDDVRDWLRSSISRDAVREATNAAIARRVFGSPTFAVGNELFWGVDRMWLLDRYLASGGKYEPSSDPISDARRITVQRPTQYPDDTHGKFVEYKSQLS